MEVASIEQVFVVKLKENEELLSSIKQGCRSKGVERGIIIAIGALKKAKVRYFVAPGRREQLEINKQVEALLFGTVAAEDSEITIHAHVMLGDKRGGTIVGHLVEGIVNPEAELLILSLSVER